jgi:hypothetical protein
VVLQEPQATVGLEIYSRHPLGLPPSIEEKPLEPLTSVVALVVKGKATLAGGGKSFALHAPPGTARISWDSITRQFGTEYLDKLPEAILILNPLDKKKMDLICACASQLNTKEIGAVLNKLVKSEDKADRLVGVTAAGALDQLGQVILGLTNPKHADVRDQAVPVLRHWMGREPGQVAKLYQAFVEDEKYSKVHAKTIVQLLFGFNDADRKSPATYDLLIPALNHSQLAVRHLVYWNLVRLVPEGMDIGYDAAASEADRKKAIEQWRQLVPEGKLPQPAKAGKKS